MNILVYLPSAQALSFNNCEILVDDVNLFIFNYTSKGDGLIKKAKFYTKNMVGYATFYDEAANFFKDYFPSELKNKLEKEPPEVISNRDMKVQLNSPENLKMNLRKKKMNLRKKKRK